MYGVCVYFSFIPLHVEMLQRRTTALIIHNRWPCMDEKEQESWLLRQTLSDNFLCSLHGIKQLDTHKGAVCINLNSTQVVVQKVESATLIPLGPRALPHLCHTRDQHMPSTALTCHEASWTGQIVHNRTSIPPHKACANILSPHKHLSIVFWGALFKHLGEKCFATQL